MVSSTLSLSLDLLSNLATLASFVPIIWSLSGPLAFSLFGHGLMIPGYMVWVGLAYAAFGSWATQLFARRLAVIEYDRQRFEADFRYLLVRVRENAEQIALYDGAAAEERHLKTSFSRIRENWRLVMTYTKRLNLVTAMYNQVGSIFPIIAAAPRFFSGALSFGVLIQLANGFGNMSTAMSWFLNNYGALATWRATMNRLREVARAIEAPEPEGGIVTTRAPGPALATHGLKLALPSGEPLNSIGDWRIEPGSRWLVRGPSGCGKSTLVRALAGLWPFGHGSVLKPDSMRSLFLPQRSYLPIGSLKTALCYPGAPTDFTDERCRDVLGACRIPMGDHLEQVADWSQRLSPGEQQRLAAARALLQEPDYLFLDEATSALDPETERLVYHALLERLPRTAFISVAHSQMLLAMHPSILDVKAIGAQQDVSPAGV
jgi:putative ATP-binding cassette transporter